MISPSEFETFLANLAEQLSKLPKLSQLAFGASCCERAFPNYVSFAIEEKWGDPDILRGSLDRVWSFVLGQPLTAKEAQRLEKECENVTPNYENAPNADVTAAQEAAFMTTLLLRWCHDPDPNYGVRIATFARDTIDAYVQVRDALDPTDPDLEGKITSHPLMIAELATQRDDLHQLENIAITGELAQFHRRVVARCKSNLSVSQN